MKVSKCLHVGGRRRNQHRQADDFSHNIVESPAHLNEHNATIVQCMGIDHSRFTFASQGLDMRLTGVEPAHAVKELLA